VRVISGRGLGALLLSNPGNPTGRAILGEELEAWVRTALSKAPMKEAPLNTEVALLSRKINLPNKDPSDRFIAATASVFGVGRLASDAVRAATVSGQSGTRRGTGWPRGCNSLFFGMLEWAYHKMAAGQVPNYKAIFVVGPDGAPIKKNWLQLLTTAWDVANKKQKIYVAGAMVDGSPEGKKHINGDAMLLSGDLAFLKWLTLDISDIKIAAGWDWILAGAFEKRGWKDFPFVKSIWRRTAPFTQADWDAENTFGTVWYHGIKTDDLLDLSRKNLVT
jgi:hypothetical protein